MRNLTLVAALIVTTLATAAIAADWVAVGTDSSGIVYIYDRQSIRTMADGFKRAWVRTYYIKEKKLLSHTRFLAEFDCRQLRTRTLQLDVFNGEKEAKSVDTNTGEWFYAPPGSVGETLLNYACFGKSDQ